MSSVRASPASKVERVRGFLRRLAQRFRNVNMRLYEAGEPLGSLAAAPAHHRSVAVAASRFLGVYTSSLWNFAVAVGTGGGTLRA